MSKNFFEVKNVDFKVGGKTKVANVSFAIGSILTLIGLRKFIDNAIYVYSRNKKS